MRTQGKELIELVTGGAGLSKLPAPRLQLTWQQTKPDSDGYNTICHYHLVLPVGKYDIRNPHEYKRDSFLLLDLGGTRSTGLIRDRIYPDGKIDTPFRDGSHIAWDAKKLSLPAYVVCGQSSQLIEARTAGHD
jgi:hypothetical protein